MRQTRLILFGLVLACAGIAHAANSIRVEDVEVAPGGSVTLSIALENETTNLMGWQCDITLQEGLTLALKDNGKPATTLGSRFATTEHSISSSCLANGAYRFIATSMDGEAIPGTSGTLFTVTLQADASLASSTKLTGTVKNIEFNTQKNQKLTLDDVTFTASMRGGSDPGGETPGDEPIDKLKVADVTLPAGVSLPLEILLENETTNLMGWQCDITLQEGLTLALKDNGKPAATLGNRFATTEHGISSIRLANGAYRFIATSMDGEAIPGTIGTLFTVTLHADASLTSGTKLTGMVKNTEFNTQDNQKLTLDDVTFTISIGGVKGDLNSDGNVDVGDIMAIINFMAAPTGEPGAFDLNGDGNVDVGDIMAIINMMAQ